MSGEERDPVKDDASWRQGFRAGQITMLMEMQGILQEAISQAGPYDDTRATQATLKLVQDRLVQLQ